MGKIYELKSILSPEAYEDVANYASPILPNGEENENFGLDGFGKVGLEDLKSVGIPKVVQMLQNLADPKYVVVREDWGDTVFGDRSVVGGVAPYTNGKNNNFALKNQATNLMYLEMPMFHSCMPAEKCFENIPLSTPWAELKNSFADAKGVDIQEVADLQILLDEHFRKVSPQIALSEAQTSAKEGLLKRGFHKLLSPVLFIKNKLTKKGTKSKKHTNGKCLISQIFRGQELSDVEKFLSLVDAFSHDQIKEFKQQDAKGLDILSAFEPADQRKLLYAGQITADLFASLATDLGAGNHRQIENALKLEIAGVLGNLENKTYHATCAYGEIAQTLTGMLLKGLNLDPKAIVQNRQAMGVNYVDAFPQDKKGRPVYDLKQIMFGRTINQAFKCAENSIQYAGESAFFESLQPTAENVDVLNAAFDPNPVETPEAEDNQNLSLLDQAFAEGVDVDDSMEKRNVNKQTNPNYAEQRARDQEWNNTEHSHMFNQYSQNGNEGFNGMTDITWIPSLMPGSNVKSISEIGETIWGLDRAHDILYFIGTHEKKNGTPIEIELPRFSHYGNPNSNLLVESTGGLTWVGAGSEALAIINAATEQETQKVSSQEDSVDFSDGDAIDPAIWEKFMRNGGEELVYGHKTKPAEKTEEVQENAKVVSQTSAVDPAIWEGFMLNGGAKFLDGKAGKSLEPAKVESADEAQKQDDRVVLMNPDTSRGFLRTKGLTKAQIMWRLIIGIYDELGEDILGTTKTNKNQVDVQVEPEPEVTVEELVSEMPTITRQTKPVMSAIPFMADAGTQEDLVAKKVKHGLKLFDATMKPAKVANDEVVMQKVTAGINAMDDVMASMITKSAVEQMSAVEPAQAKIKKQRKYNVPKHRTVRVNGDIIIVPNRAPRVPGRAKKLVCKNGEMLFI